MDATQKTAFETAKQLYKEKKIDECKASFEKLLAENYEVAQSHYYLGLIDLAAKKTDSSQEHFSKSLILEPDNYHASYFLAECFAMKGNKDLAYRYYTKVLEIHPDHKLAKKKLEDYPSSDQKSSVKVQPNAKAQKPKQDVGKEPPPVKAVPVYPAEFHGDLFDMLAMSKDTQSIAAVSLIEKIRLNKRLNLSAYMGEFIALTFLTLILLIPLQSVFRYSYGLKNLSWALVGVLVIYVICKSIIVKAARVIIDRGVIQITRGVFFRRTRIFNIHTITAFEVTQSFLNRMSNDATIGFTDPVSSGSRQGEKIKITGLLKYNESQRLVHDLRSLHYMLRASNVIKGGLFG